MLLAGSCLESPLARLIGSFRYQQDLGRPTKLDIVHSGAKKTTILIMCLGYRYRYNFR